MAGKSMVGAPNQAPSTFVLTDYAGTETADTLVGAGTVGILINSTVSLTSINVDVIIEQLSDALREQVSKLA